MLACRPQSIRTSSIIGSTLLLGACFDPDPTPLETVGEGTTAADSTTGSMTACEPGEVQDCACAGGGTGTQTCSDDGNGFGACECEGADSSSTTEPSASTTDATTGLPPECEVDDDCNQAEGMDCQVDTCTDGVCMVESLPEGTACGDDTETECSGADACDGKGTCVPNDVAEGSACSDCPLGVCTCSGGACADCNEFAPANNFITTRSIAGWMLSGGWGLYREAPQSNSGGPIVFGSQVFGTDGNRSMPYPGGESEMSSARSGMVTLPATLELLSWNVDEGGLPYDNKQIRVSNDGGVSFVTLVDCMVDATPPFCQFRDETRAPDDWDAISIPVPADMVDDPGFVEFTYATGDECCGFERGWFIDATNFATECACADDGACNGLGGECGAAVCGGTGECELDAMVAGTACGDAADEQCNDPDACDGNGYCALDQAVNGSPCEDCPAGPGTCNACQEGTCVDCTALVPNDFGGGVPAGWAIEGLSGTTADWQIYASAPQSQAGGSTPTPLSFAPSFGTDGNRQAPYPGSENEHSRITTVADVVPAQITFSSWNVDEGSGVDNKLIEISVDGGASWNVLVDCGAGIGGAPAFCMFRDDPRPGDEWNDIVIDTGAFVGQVGQLRFTYNTLDACCGFERGWFIDNLNFGQLCADSPFP